MWVEAYVGDAQSRQVVPLEFATHPLAGPCGLAISQSRGDVAAASSTKSANLLAWVIAIIGHGIRSRGGSVVGRSHGVFEGTPGGEMFALTDTALDFLVTQLLFQTLLLGLATSLLGFFGLHILPISAGSEDNVLAHRRGVRLRTFWLALLEAELGPFSPLGDDGVDFFFVYGRAGSPRGLYFATLVVNAI